MILRVHDPISHIIKRSKVLKNIEKGDDDDHSQYIHQVKSNIMFKLSKFPDLTDSPQIEDPEADRRGGVQPDDEKHAEEHFSEA